MACQWEDEQTGGHCPALAEHMSGTSRKWFTFTNGAHVDSLDPETFNRWCDFLQLYVAQRTPLDGCAATHVAAPVIYHVAMGVDGVTLPPDPIQAQPTYEGALAAFERLSPIRILFDNGAGAQPGYPVPAFESSFRSFPIPGTVARSWYLQRGGTLRGKPAARAGANAFTWNAHARPLTDFTGDTGSGPNGLWTAAPSWRWTRVPRGSAVSYVSAPLSANTVVIGAGAVHVFVRSSRPNVDLQATVSEVRPDGKETYVQSGWLRANERKLDRRRRHDTGDRAAPFMIGLRPESTPLEPVLSLRAKDVRSLPRNRFVEVTIPLYYEGHAYRAGSRIRVTISAPNGDQPTWSFSETQPRGKATVAIAFSKKMRSRLTLPVVPGVDVPTGLPACPGLRNEPCRSYRALANRRARL
jgi:hypothetical protein